MSEKDVFAQRKTGLEEEYFRKKEQELLEQIQRRACHSPKLYPACIFNNFIKLLAARSGDVVRRLQRSRLPLPNPAAASLSAPAHPYTKINVF